MHNHIERGIINIIIVLLIQNLINRTVWVSPRILSSSFVNTSYTINLIIIVRKIVKLRTVLMKMQWQLYAVRLRIVKLYFFFIVVRFISHIKVFQTFIVTHTFWLHRASLLRLYLSIQNVSRSHIALICREVLDVSLLKTLSHNCFLFCIRNVCIIFVQVHANLILILRRCIIAV